MSKIISFLNEESGASAAEYALILAIIASAIAIALGTLRDSISTAISGAAGQI